MKRGLIFSIICVLVLSANQVTALTYKDAFPAYMPGESLSISKHSEAKLLQTYTIRYREKINSLYSSYSWEKSQVMSDANAILIKMSSSLQKLQDNNINDSNATQIMQSIVNDLKVLNNRMKIYLEQEHVLLQRKIQKEKNKYNAVVQRISHILDTIISQLSKSLAKKENLNEKEKSIVRSLIKIREENGKMKKFMNTSFHSKNEIEIYLKNIIGNIRNEIVIIKQLSN